jgi:predicted MFS family arabinose efflux permease
MSALCTPDRLMQQSRSDCSAGRSTAVRMGPQDDSRFRRSAAPSAFYVVAYAALSLPAIAGGVVVSSLGLRPTFEVFGGAVAALALLVAVPRRTRPRTRRLHYRLAYQATR